MCSFEIAARVRVINKLLIEAWIQHAVDGVMQKSVSDRSFVNISGFRITYRKCLVSTMSIVSGPKILMESENIL